MTLVGLVTLLLVTSTGQLVREALAAAAPALRVEVVDTGLALPPGCALAGVTAEPVRRSGVVALSLAGRGCGGRGWARVRVYAPAWTTARAVKRGEPLAGAVQQAEREVLGDARLDAVPQGARAAMSLSRGLVLEARHLRPEGPQPGTRVTVVVVVGALRIEREAVALACPGRACARLDNGRRLEGTLVDGKVLVKP